MFWKKNKHTGKKIALLPTSIDNPNMENDSHTPHTICAKHSSLTHIVKTTNLFLEKPKLFGYPYRITY